MIRLADERSVDALSRLRWDLIVVGGGITGAGVFRETARAGLRVLLIEANDFASGTSSRSSKLVHGGLQYLGRLQARLALESIRERNRLLRSHPGLVFPLDLEVPRLPGAGVVGRVKLAAAIGLYRALGGGRSGTLSSLALPEDAEPASPRFAPGIVGCHRYVDGRTDDARLVLQVIREGVQAGGVARSYTAATDLVRDETDQVRGVRARETGGSREIDLHARVVVNATGPWTDGLRARIGAVPRIRLVRGSHLVLPWERLPLRTAVVHLRPSDGCPVVMLPWEGVTLVGGTAVEYAGSPAEEPRISPSEVACLLEDVRRVFPHARIRSSDVQATFSGYRPLVDRDTSSAVRASRNDEVWEEAGLITVTGGKLTTFRAMALRVLDQAALAMPHFNPSKSSPAEPDGEPLPPFHRDGIAVPDPALLRLVARYGDEAAREIRGGGEGNRLERELAWSARWEGVRHLDDLLLRRVRLGFLAAEGGVPRLPHFRRVLTEALGWSDGRWRYEVERYAHLWQETMAPPPPEPRSNGLTRPLLVRSAATV